MTLLTDEPFYSDQFVQYEVKINSGAQAATNVVLDSEYDGLYLGINGCAFLPCQFPSLPANSDINLVFDMLAPQMIPGVREQSTHTVFVSAGQTDPELSDNTASITTDLIQAADVQTQMILNSEPPYYQGQIIEYSLDVRNRGLNDVGNVEIMLVNTENLELVWALSQNCSTLDCLVPYLDFDQSEEFTIQMKIMAPGDFDVTAKAGSTDFDPLPDNNIDSNNNGGTATAIPNDLIFADDFEE